MDCYLCGKPAELFVRKNGYSIFQCRSCGFAQTDLHRNLESFVKENYGKGYFMGEPQYSAYVNYKEDKPYILMNMRKFLGKIRKYKTSGTLLDIGCAMGFFVELALSAGFDAYGLDASHFAAHEGQKLLDGRIKEGMVENALYPAKKFDVITMFDVFEHLGDPVKDLKKISSWLKDDGILVIATGNRKSVAARFLRRRWTFYIPPQHLFFFDRETMTAALWKAHFEPVVWSKIGKWLSLQYVLHLARTTGESIVAKCLYPLAAKLRFGSIPLYIPLQDNMVVIARKKK